MSEVQPVEPTPTPTPAPVQTPQPAVVTNDKFFPYDYVKDLREEAAANRVKASKLSEELEKLKNDYTLLKDMPEKYQTALSELKGVYLQKIPEEKREKFKDFDLTQLKIIAEEWTQPITNSPGTQKGEIDLALSWEEMTGEQRAELQAKNPAHFNKLLMESIYGKKE